MNARRYALHSVRPQFSLTPLNPDEIRILKNSNPIGFLRFAEILNKFGFFTEMDPDYGRATR